MALRSDLWRQRFFRIPPDQHHCPRVFARLAAAKGEKSWPLPSPPAIKTTLCVMPSQRRDRRAYVGPFRVIVECDAAESRHLLHPVRQTPEIRAKPQQGSNGRPTARHSANAASALATLCRPATRSSLVFIRCAWPCASQIFPLSRRRPKSFSPTGDPDQTLSAFFRPAPLRAPMESSRFKICTPGLHFRHHGCPVKIFVPLRLRSPAIPA